MKNKYVSFLLFVFLVPLQFTNASTSDTLTVIDSTVITPAKDTSQMVYICTGKKSRAYHSKYDCEGLMTCVGRRIHISENTAINQYNRIPCCRCWNNVADECCDDYKVVNEYVYTPDPIELVPSNDFNPIILIPLFFVFLSNDVYLYPCLNFHEKSDPRKVNYSFGLRKTFKYSALEYGFTTHMMTQTSAADTFGIPIGVQFNYIHEIFYKYTPLWLRFYVGPSLYIYDSFALGAIVGAQIKLSERFKFDVRYQLTTNTSQLQAGIIFKYQKKYPWQ
jgi:hypothetical protein